MTDGSMKIVFPLTEAKAKRRRPNSNLTKIIIRVSPCIRFQFAFSSVPGQQNSLSN